LDIPTYIREHRGVISRLRAPPPAASKMAAAEGLERIKNESVDLVSYFPH
jgi:hypothetical protein